MTRIEFAECIAILSAGVGREMPEAQARVWFEVLGDLSVPQLRTAVVRSLKEHKFAGFPPVGVLRDYAGCGAVAAVPASDRAVIAWDCVMQAMRDHGAYRSVVFDDPAVTAAVRSVGGWQFICDAETDQLFQFVKPRFLEAYRAHANVGVRAIAAEPLVGILAADAARDGYESPGVQEIDTGLPPSKTIGEPRRHVIEAASEPRRLMESALPNIVTDLELPQAEPQKPLPSVDEQKAALIARFGTEV